MTSSFPLKRYGMFAAKLIGVCLIIYILIYFNLINLKVLVGILKQPVVLAFCATAIFLSYITGAGRWWFILRTQGIRVSFFYLFNIHTLGTFSLIFLPGGTASSDGVRIISLLRGIKHEKARVVLSVFFDRFCAVFTLSLAAALFSLLNWHKAAGEIFWLKLLALLLPFALVTGALVSYALAARLSTSTWGKRYEDYFVWRALVAAAGFVDLVRRSPRLVMSALLLSGLTTTLLIAAIVFVGAGTQAPDLTLIDMAEAAALSMFSNGVPITPGGIGIGEAAFNQICTWLAGGNGGYPYGTIFLGYRVISLVTACYGIIPLVNLDHLKDAKLLR